jgi:hypothetical protein
MKFILLPATILFTVTLFAQEGSVPPEQKFPKVPLGIPPFGLHKKKVASLEDIKALTIQGQRQMLPSLHPQSKYLSALPNGNLVFALPQDNMPCIIPNENGSVPMPNVSAIPTVPYRYKGPGAIPNPAIPILIQNPKKK